jgi:hypothetical protein
VGAAAPPAAQLCYITFRLVRHSIECKHQLSNIGAACRWPADGRRRPSRPSAERNGNTAASCRVPAAGSGPQSGGRPLWRVSFHIINKRVLRRRLSRPLACLRRAGPGRKSSNETNGYCISEIFAGAFFLSTSGSIVREAARKSNSATGPAAPRPQLIMMSIRGRPDWRTRSPPSGAASLLAGRVWPKQTSRPAAACARLSRMRG